MLQGEILVSCSHSVFILTYYISSGYDFYYTCFRACVMQVSCAKLRNCKQSARFGCADAS